MYYIVALPVSPTENDRKRGVSDSDPLVLSDFAGP